MANWMERAYNFFVKISTTWFKTPTYPICIYSYSNGEKYPVIARVEWKDSPQYVVDVLNLIRAAPELKDYLNNPCYEVRVFVPNLSGSENAHIDMSDPGGIKVALDQYSWINSGNRIVVYVTAMNGDGNPFDESYQKRIDAQRQLAQREQALQAVIENSFSKQEQV